MKKIQFILSFFLFLTIFLLNNKAVLADQCKFQVLTDSITQDKQISIKFYHPSGYGIGLTDSYSLLLDGSPLPEAKNLKQGWQTINFGPIPAGNHSLLGKAIRCAPRLTCLDCTQDITVYEKEGTGTNCIYCTTGFHYNQPYKLCCKNDESPECKTQKNSLCAPEKMKDYSTTTTSKNTCSSINDKTNKEEFDKCVRCKDGLGEFAGNPGSWSVLGCIPTFPDKFIQWLLEKAINIVGGLAFLMILFGSFKVATSSGNPEALNEGKDIIFAALAGLIFIVFSVVLLKIIGADILQIPGFQ